MIYILIVLTAICGILIAYIIYNNKHSIRVSPSNYINPNDTMGVDYEIYGLPEYKIETQQIEVSIQKHTKYPITVNMKQDVGGVLIVEITDTFSEN